MLPACSASTSADHPIDLTGWEQLVDQVDAAERPVRIGIIGKYVNLPDAYLSVVEALRHAGFHHGARVEIDWIQAERCPTCSTTTRLAGSTGSSSPAASASGGSRARSPRPATPGSTRSRCLGLCLGLQAMVIEFARHLAGLDGANSREFDADHPHPVIDLMDEQDDVVDLGGTMRLGSYVRPLAPGSQVAEPYGDRGGLRAPPPPLRGQPPLPGRLEEAGLVCSGISPDGRLVEFIELPGHPFWVGTQAHPEFKSRPDRPHPLFRELVEAALDRAEGRDPRLIDIDADH